MGFSIDSFSLQVNTYLSTAQKKHCCGLAPIRRQLTKFIKRLACCISHGFKFYPNDRYLLKKFEKYDFNTISKPEQCKKIELIYKRFQKSEIKPKDLKKVEQELESVKVRLWKANVEKAEVDLKKNKPEIDSADNSIKVKDETESTVSEEETSKSETSKSETSESDNDKDLPTAKELLSNDDDLSVSKSNVASEAELKSEDKVPSKDLSKNEIEVEGKSSRSNVDVSSDKTLNKKDSSRIQDSSKSEAEPPENSSRSNTQLEVTNEEESDSQEITKKSDSDSEKVTETRSLEQPDIAESAPIAKNDEELSENQEGLDPVFKAAWNLAYEKRAEWHAEFKNAFSDSRNPLPQLEDNGEVICSEEHLDWLISRFKCLPALELFDSTDESQNCDMAFLTHSILFGSDIENKHIASPCFIRLRETIGMKTSICTGTTNSNSPNGSPKKQVKIPETLSGSSIYTSLMGLDNQVNPEEIKQKLNKKARAYVENWFERPGISLGFNNIMMQSGTKDAANWVACVRDTYTESLLKLPNNQLRSFLSSMNYRRALENSLVTAYEAEMAQKEWENSEFPAKLIEKMFEDTLKENENNPEICRAIRQTIENANFSPENLTKLQDKSKFDSKKIEPLIRICILYILNCLGQKSVDAVVEGIKQRVQKMNDPALTCESNGERRLFFDEKLNELTLSVNIDFKDSRTPDIVAQGQSSIYIDSLNHSKKKGTKVSRIDLQDLRFSLKSSKAQRGYLILQVAPQSFMHKMAQLSSNMSALEIVERAKQYEQAKQEYDKKWVKWWLARPFDLKTYQRPNEDQATLVDLLTRAQNFVAYCDYETVLFSELTEPQKQDFQTNKKKIHSNFTTILQMLKAVYISSMTVAIKSGVISDKIDELSTLLAQVKTD